MPSRKPFAPPRPLVDVRIQRARQDARSYVTSTTVIHGPWVTTRDPLTEGYRDAADECAHGALPTDRVVACGCWAIGVAA